MAYSKVQIRRVSGAAAAVAVLFAAGCTQRNAPPSDQQVQQQAASDANRLHHDLTQAGDQARVALNQARRDAKDAIAGARQGWDEGSGRNSGMVDINQASEGSLVTLPGIHPATARAIISNRPYASARELETRGIVSRTEYARISGLVTAR